ncbi:SpoIID/LytB domain-containing protein [Calothrix sp. 336/3]|uniref:SpoIID/LytB domain-containing protein n=1 Tax=Calothrix sp. 336/3 TaxID=1337936 RepID=UPI0004E3AEBE|nr:SpoIID/LytB domain-containing protein [Calothrix sp. 336/3]AKG24068.1 amidase [Calothrix sp. 336/3]
MKTSLWRFSTTLITTFCLLGLTAASRSSNAATDIVLKIGIVQRFGNAVTDKLEIVPTQGDRLELKFSTGNGNKTIATNKPVKLEIATSPLKQATLEERVVLGTYRTYETAEDSAKKWRKQGIEVEIAQPERWQVWAKRDVYNTPLLRRLLLRSVKSLGTNLAYLDTKIIDQVPVVSWEVEGNRYNRTNLEISSGKSLIQVNQGKNLATKRLYAGRMEIQPNAYGTYSLINNVALETYLRGVVPYEIGTQAPKAALEAQAILARTYVLRNLRRFEIDGYQLCADTHCQVYYGLKDAAASTDKAIAATRGMVLIYNNELVDALYSSTTGGITASFSDVWNGEDRPYLRPIIDAPNDLGWTGKSLSEEEVFQKFISLREGFNESEGDLFRWRRETKIEDITKGLQKFLKVKNSPYAKFKTIKNMAVVQRSHSGRILKLAVNTDIGTFTLHKDEVRSAFFAPISTLFYLQTLNKGEPGIWGYAFVGGGLGHGVGLSQIGAQNLAKLGWSSEKILKFYYPGTELQLLNDKIKFTE